MLLKLQKKIEQNTGLLIFGILVVSSIGGLVQIVPSLATPALSTASAGVVPHSPLVLAGREVYIRESCALCHSQQIRPLLAEVKRYGPHPSAGDFAYDRPFLWGSKRTGPDLMRVGGKYSDEWHRRHMIRPQSVVPSSIMPGYPWLQERMVNAADIQNKMRVLRKLGHPYSDSQVEAAATELEGKTEMDALIAYLQSLGKGNVASPP